MKKYTQQTWPIIIKAVNELCDFVKPTFGPASNRVIVQQGRGIGALDDGVAISEMFELEDELENAVIKVIKEVAKKTNDRVGDGTTGSLIILQALINEIGKPKEANKIIAELHKGLAEFKTEIQKRAKTINSKDELARVAYIAFNNESIAKVIAETLWEIGHEGITTVEESDSLETTHEIVKGLQLPKGFKNPYFINNPEKAEVILEKPYILVSDREIVDGKDILPILDKVIKSGNRQLLVIADDIRGEALAIMIINKVKGNAMFCAVDAPYYSNRKYEGLMDVATLTGANFQMGVVQDLKNLELEDLGSADRVIITKDSTTIVGGKGKNLDDYVNELKALIKSSKSELDKSKMEERLAKLTSGVAVIKVGGATENEMKALRYKVEDAVNATKVAYKSGVVKGAGLTLKDIKTSSKLLNRALEYPHRQLLENSGIKELEINEGIIDPVEVLIAQVESAVSIVSLLISTKGILVDKLGEKKNGGNI